MKKYSCSQFLLSGLAALLLLGTSLSSMPVLSAAAASSQQVCPAGNCPEWKAYDAQSDAGFGFCHVEALAAYWHLDNWATKIKIGHKLLTHNQSALDEEFNRSHARCTTAFNFEDAPDVAALWTDSAQG